MNDPVPNGTSAGAPLVLVVAAALIDGEGRVLMTKRPQGKALAGLWEFPGGKLNAGETPEVALIRELKEELGIDVEALDLEPALFASHAYPELHLLMPLYLCRKWAGVPRALERQALRWVSLEDMAALAMPEADVPLIDRLARWLTESGRLGG
jgi:8-oxo-dGTP diphosphatase